MNGLEQSGIEQVEQINLDDWVHFGEGVTGKSYYHVSDQDIMLKLYDATIPFEEVKGEFNRGFVASSLQLPVPACYKMVSCGDRLGIVFQRIHDKISIARAIGDNPNRMEEYVQYLVEIMQRIHATQADTKAIPEAGELFKSAVNACYCLSDTQRLEMLQFLDSIKGPVTCVHGDFHVGNVIIARDKVYVIDLNMFSYGDHLFDEASLFYVCVVSPSKNPARAQNLYHMRPEDLQETWRVFCRLHADANTPSQRAEYEHMLLPYMQIDLVRKVVGSNYSESMVAIMKEVMG